MINSQTTIDKVWQHLADRRSIEGKHLIEIMGNDAHTAFQFYEFWEKKGVLGIPLMHSRNETVKGTKVPFILRYTDEVGRDYLRSQGYNLK